MLVFASQHLGRTECGQMPYDDKGGFRVRMSSVKGVRVSYQHPVYVVDVSKGGNAHLVHQEKYQ